MPVLWDTSVLIAPPVGSDDLVMISVVSVMELSAGVNAARDDRSRAERLALLTRVVSVFEPLPVDVRVATAYGLVDARVRAAGRSSRRRFADLQIAATALAHDLALVTRNPDDVAGLEGLVTVTHPDPP